MQLLQLVEGNFVLVDYVHNPTAAVTTPHIDFFLVYTSGHALRQEWAMTFAI